MSHCDKSHKIYLPDNLQHLLMDSEFVTPGPVPCIPVALKSLKTQNNSQQASRRMLRSITERLFSLHVKAFFKSILFVWFFVCNKTIHNSNEQNIVCLQNRYRVNFWTNRQKHFFAQNAFIFFLNAALLIYVRCGYMGLFYRSTLGNWCGACDWTSSR